MEERSGRPVTILGPNLVIKGGSIQADHDVRVDGRVEADVSVRGKVVISADAAVEGRVRADELVIEGEVAGEIEARELLALRAAARVKGSIRAERLIVEEGAQCSAECAVGKELDLPPRRGMRRDSEPQLVASRTSPSGGDGATNSGDSASGQGAGETEDAKQLSTQ